MSSAEAEYAAASQTCREMAYIRHVCLDLGLTLTGPLCVGVDNTAAISIYENPGIMRHGCVHVCNTSCACWCGLLANARYLSSRILEVRTAFCTKHADSSRYEVDATSVYHITR